MSNYIAPGDRTEFRAMPTAGVEYRYPFINVQSWGTQTITPIAQVIVRPNEPSIGKFPNEDAQSLIFDDSNLFKIDKFSGWDRIEGGGRANVGLQYTAQFNRAGFVNVLFGQSYQLFGINSFAVGDVTNTGLGTGLDTNVSDYVARVSYQPDRDLHVHDALPLRPGHLRLEPVRGRRPRRLRSHLAVGAVRPVRPAAGARLPDLAPRHSADHAGQARHQLGGQTAALNYDVDAGKFSSTQFGLGYIDDCFIFAGELHHRLFLQPRRHASTGPRSPLHADDRVAHHRIHRNVAVGRRRQRAAWPAVAVEAPRRRSFNVRCADGYTEQAKDNAMPDLARPVRRSVAAFWRLWRWRRRSRPRRRRCPPHAQQVVVLVNGDPITAFDIEQRTKLIQLTTQKTPSRQEVIEELIEEKLKLQLLKRYSIEGMDNDVENAFANMARRARMTPQQLTEQLARSGVTPGTLKSRIKAEITWNQVIRGKFQSSFQFSEKDIMAKLEASNPDAAASVGYDYTLRPILFVVPRGSPDSLRETRRKEAEALRARFQNCDEGIRLARGLRDVAVRAPTTRSSADLPPALREILEKTEIGKLTSPEVTPQGIEVYALCRKEQSSAENTPDKRKVREELMNAQFQANSKRFMKELRSQAMIEYR